MSDYYISARALTACSGKVCPVWNKGKSKMCRGLSHKQRLGTIATLSISCGHVKDVVEKELGHSGTFKPSQRSEKLETQDHAVSPAGHTRMTRELTNWAHARQSRACEGCTQVRARPIVELSNTETCP